VLRRAVSCTARVLLGVETGTSSMKVRDLIRMLERDGWKQVRMRGSHRKFRHPWRPGRVTVAGKPGADIPPGTLASILKQAGFR